MKRRPIEAVVLGALAFGSICLALYWLLFSSVRIPFYTLPSLKSESEIIEADGFLGDLRRSVTGHDLNFPLIGVVDSGLDLELTEKEGVTFDARELVDLSLTEGGMRDELSHGTGLFLQLAARKNGFGMVGLLPEAKVLPIRIGNESELKTAALPISRLREAFRLAKDRGIRLLGLSLSNVISLWPKAEMDALLLAYANDFLVVASSGNDGWNLSYGDKCTYIPVCNRSPNLIKVGASDYRFSNRGEPVDLWVDSKSYQWRRVAAEGEKLFEMQAVSSTSVAVPKVVAAAALVLARSPALTPGQLKRRLIDARDAAGKLNLPLLLGTPP